MELFKVYAQDRVQPLLVELIILVFSRVRAQQRFVELIILVSKIFSQDRVHLRLLAQVSSVVDVLKIFAQDRVQRRLGGGPGGVPVSIFPEHLSHGIILIIFFLPSLFIRFFFFPFFMFFSSFFFKKKNIFHFSLSSSLFLLFHFQSSEQTPKPERTVE